MTTSQHDLLLRPAYSVLPNVLPFVAGDGEVREDEIPQIYPSVMAMMNSSHQRDPDPATRACVLDLLLLCARHKPSRLVLKHNGVYPVVREWHKYEQASVYANQENDNRLQDLVPYLLLDEEETSQEGGKQENSKQATLEVLDDEANEEEEMDKIKPVIEMD
jgi:hypothetical protein